VADAVGVGITFIEATVDDALALTVEVYGDLGGPEHCQILGAIKNGPIGTKSLNLTEGSGYAREQGVPFLGRLCYCHLRIARPLPDLPG
jgi:hypothetical protein